MAGQAHFDSYAGGYIGIAAAGSKEAGDIASRILDATNLEILEEISNSPILAELTAAAQVDRLGSPSWVETVTNQGPGVSHPPVANAPGHGRTL